MITFVKLFNELESEIICKLIPPKNAFMMNSVSNAIYNKLKNIKLNAIVEANNICFIDNFIDKLLTNTKYYLIEIHLVNCNLNSVVNITQVIENILKKNNKLIKLNLKENNLLDDKGEKLASLLHDNTVLRNLDLSDNFLGDKDRKSVV